MGVYNLNHDHEWEFIGTAEEHNEFFKVYQCRECSCWARQKLNKSGEEKLSRGEVVRPATGDNDVRE